jgi:hypothetical protein
MRSQPKSPRDSACQGEDATRETGWNVIECFAWQHDQSGESFLIAGRAEERISQVTDDEHRI